MRGPRIPSLEFPPVELADDNGLLAYGGDLTIERLVSAYESGVFPWYEATQPILWWAPPKRMVLYPQELKMSKSLAQSIRNRGFELRIDTAFSNMIELCAETPRSGQNGTWLTEEMQKAYVKLHDEGFAHSFEIWRDDELVGGLYGLCLGKAFFGESMFSKARDASKVAFYHLSEFSKKHDIKFIDCQLHTTHLESLGAKEVARKQFMKELKEALAYPDRCEKWTNEIK
ncbi:MAG: leucyl/phenylalanyl-tRNA--protein transferase [Flavobacteriales bacterium]|jgi:leucyl/phenylalanyl-tRNA--protein transferase|nr:leucyl/phenylalanyl-tRNA--protein transferase [Flavobacteriales bacterium]NCG30427.1 leucyl/phenylalanyl-tRNA--protein transferase [Bacteroidota bacterium]MBT3962567.1 leucyl/phenylalanyl-tRNA--protein transferase [Flavobacteriales bacterium]MBT4705212.1 leucyl/phenylalanyl-tRNA--protein transferase [Flavobacteriales bacterium]MBT4930372.1 leucyl/phenylalanyl-tRNA--protein transferase [Flavobacteriales bacterium]